jgi:alkyl hydroperoxide reductase subunit AhpC
VYLLYSLISLEINFLHLSESKDSYLKFQLKGGNKIILLFSQNLGHVMYKNTNHQQMHKESFIINCNTLLHVSTLLGHLHGELFVIVTLRLHFIVEWECAVDCVLRCLWRRGRDRREFTPPVHSTQSTAHSHSTIVHASSTQYTVNSTFSLNYKVQP